jgi:protein TonB
MTPRRGLATLLGSVALHVAAIAAVVSLAAALRQPEPLFVDLTGGAPAGDERVGAAAPPRGREAAAPPARHWRSVSARASHAPAASAPARPAEPMPAPAPSFSISPETAAPEQGAPAPAAASDGSRAGGGASDAPAYAGQSAGAAGGGASLRALAGPAAGRGEVPPEFGPYLAGFRHRIQELVVYPLAARRRGLAGRVELELLLEPSGRVRDIAVVATSSHALLDDAAVDAVRALRPMPLPENLPRRPLRVRLPVVFELQ